MSIQDRRSYDWFEYIYTRQIYAWRREGGRITGCLGPYRLEVARETDVTRLDYDADRRWVVWARLEMAAGNFDLTG